jgi:hypothetical protein
VAPLCRQFTQATTEYQYEREKAESLEMLLHSKSKDVLELQSQLAQLESSLALKTAAEAQQTEELHQIRCRINQLEVDLRTARDLNSSLTQEARQARISEQHAITHAQKMQADLAASKSSFEHDLRKADEAFTTKVADVQNRAQQEIQGEQHESNKLRILIEDLTIVLAEKEDELVAATDALAQVSTRLQAADVEAAAARAVCNQAHAAISISSSCPVTPRYLERTEKFGPHQLTLSQTHSNATATQPLRTSSLLGMHSLSRMIPFQSAQLRPRHSGKIDREETSQHLHEEGRSRSVDAISTSGTNQTGCTDVHRRHSTDTDESVFRHSQEPHISQPQARSLASISSHSPSASTQEASQLLLPIWDKQMAGDSKGQDPSKEGIPQGTFAGSQPQTVSNNASKLKVSDAGCKTDLLSTHDASEPNIPKLDLHAVQARNSTLIRSKRVDLMQSRQSQVEIGRKKFRTSSFALPSRVSKIT